MGTGSANNFRTMFTNLHEFPSIFVEPFKERPRSASLRSVPRLVYTFVERFKERSREIYNIHDISDIHDIHDTYDYDTYITLLTPTPRHPQLDTRTTTPSNRCLIYNIYDIHDTYDIHDKYDKHNINEHRKQASKEQSKSKHNEDCAEVDAVFPYKDRDRKVYPSESPKLVYLFAIIIFEIQ